MAAPASSQNQSNASGPSASSWTRSGEPGSAFNGLSRGGRGRGSARGRGGNRGGRGGSRDNKPIGDSNSDKPNTTSTSKSPQTPSIKPMTIPPPTANDKATATPNAPTARPRGNPRRASRSIPTVVVPPVGPDAPNSPSVSKPSNRRRRSQSGKPPPALPKINVPSHDDNLLRPQRPRMGPVPYTAPPLKDAPPHLNGSPFNKGADIDALVERIRAAAMDNRPNTPGSHFDWAGEDDDSLPDIDDWDIGPSKLVPAENGLISPLGVSGLRPLPDVLVDTEASPPRIESSSPADVTISDQSVDAPHKVETHVDATKPDHARVATPITTTQEPLVSAPGSAKVSLRPVLPAEPVGVVDQADQPVGVERGLASSIHAVGANVDKDDPFASFQPRAGLSASIHAPPPDGISETKSAPSDISSYSTASPERRTHNRSHTVGRPPLHPTRSDNYGRPSRSGYNSPRSGLSAGHTRTHSTPPSGTHRAPAHRPIITGDAMSRLAAILH